MIFVVNFRKYASINKRWTKEVKIVSPLFFDYFKYGKKETSLEKKYQPKEKNMPCRP